MDENDWNTAYHTGYDDAIEGVKQYLDSFIALEISINTEILGEMIKHIYNMEAA